MAEKDAVVEARSPVSWWRRVVWLVIPTSVFVGDFFIRWGADITPFLGRENPENLPITFFVSAAFWWAVSVLLPEDKRRRPFAIAITGIWALLVAMAWEYRMVIKHDPNPGVLLYLIHEPTNTAQLATSGLNPSFFLNAIGLWSLWSWALIRAKTRGSRVLTAAALFVVCGWAVASAGWHDPRPHRETPYISDIHVNVLFARAVARGLEFGVESVLSRSDRPEVDLAEGAGKPIPPNVVVFVAESLRRDRLGIYGCPRETSPNIDAFVETHGERIVDFPRAQAASAFTPLALATILNGQYPGSTRDEMHDHPVLWQYANELGGTSAAVSTQLWSWSNLSMFFLLSHPPTHARSADDLNSEIVNDTGIDDRIAARAFADFLPKNRDQTPFFGVFQANSTHYPLLADEDTPWEIRERPDLYDSSIRITDEAFGIVIDQLEANGRLDDTIIFFTSDHGEYNWDKLETDLPGKSIATDLETGERIESCHPVLATVPFFVYVPDTVEVPFDALKSNASQAVSTADIFPTVLEAWGLETTESGAKPDGQSLFEPIADDRHVLCFTAPTWARWLLTGIAIFDRERAIYLREDFEHPQVFKLDDPDLYSEQFAGDPPSADDLLWLEKAAESDPMIRQYIDWTGTQTSNKTDH